jgi:hypothetical protein
MSVDEALNAILRANPKARRISHDTVNVAPGVNISYYIRSGKGGVTPNLAPVWDNCPYEDLCVWDNAWYTSAAGYRLAFYYCQQPGDSPINLGYYHFPDFTYWGHYVAGQMWNDRISSFNNYQTDGTVSHFYNWQGYWQRTLDSVAPDEMADLQTDTNGLNDTFDGIWVCGSGAP